MAHNRISLRTLQKFVGEAWLGFAEGPQSTEYAKRQRGPYPILKGMIILDERLKEIDKQFRGMPDTWHYREDVVYLLDALKRLTEENENLTVMLQATKDVSTERLCEIERLRNELKLKQDALTVAGKRIDSYQD